MRNTTFLDALAGRQPDHVPVWFMRQAGRCLPEYRQLREKHDFETLLFNPDLLAEVTLQPVDALNVDAAILFSDILVLPALLGVPLHYIDGKGPVFEQPIRSADSFRDPEPDSFAFLESGIRQIIQRSPVPLIGFCGTPWTVALYLVQGHGKTFIDARRFMREQPESFKAILSRLAEESIRLLDVHVTSGASAVQLFDSWGGMLSPADYWTYGHPYILRIVQGFKAKHPDVPVILFSRGTGAYLHDIVRETPVDAVNPDWTTDLGTFRQSTSLTAVQGNLDPSMFHASDSELRRAVQDLIRQVGRRGYVLNGGHGLHPEVDPDKVRIAIEEAHEFRE